MLSYPLFVVFSLLKWIFDVYVNVFLTQITENIDYVLFKRNGATVPNP